MHLINRTYVKAYLQNNLGDDLFLKILFERYPNNKFLIVAGKNYKEMLLRYPNVKVIKYGVFKIYDKICKILHLRRFETENIISSMCKNAMEIGGSMFIEPNIPIFNNKLLGKKDFYILGVNFGPYKTQEYRKKCSVFFDKAKDVCFRDKASYELFGEKKNTRYSTDIVFSINAPIEIEKRQIFISVMEFTGANNRYQNAYEEFIKGIIERYYEAEYDIVLSAFCKHEGDFQAVNRIRDSLREDIKSKIRVINYTSNIDEVLSAMMVSEVIVGSRFHSIVLGFVFQKKVLPICYSNKSMELLRDLDLKNNIIALEHIASLKFEEINLCKIDNDKVKELRDKAEQQFMYTDLALKKNERNELKCQDRQN